MLKAWPTALELLGVAMVLVGLALIHPGLALAILGAAIVAAVNLFAGGE